MKAITYYLRNPSDFILLIMKTVSSGLETVSYLGSKLWDISPLETKAVESLLEFKNKIRL